MFASSCTSRFTDQQYQEVQPQALKVFLAALARNQVEAHPLGMKSRQSHLASLSTHTKELLASEMVEQCAAVCVRVCSKGEIQVLLITTRSTGRWCIPKGWPIKGLKSHQVAEREAWEEAGIRGKAKKKPVSYYTYLKTLNDGSVVPSLVSVHLLKTIAEEDDYPESSERVREWLTPTEAARRVQEPELKGILVGLQHGPLVRKARKALTNHKSLRSI